MSSIKTTCLRTVRSQARLVVPASRAVGCRRTLASVKPTPRDGPALSQTNRAEVTLRRFWKTVGLKTNEQGDFLVTLDKRELKTPGGKKLVIPRQRRLLAMLIANEWENQSSVLKQHSLTVTSLASRAIDGLSDPETRKGVVEALSAYLDTDTVVFPTDDPPRLVSQQERHWAPLHTWVRSEFNEDLVLAHGISAPTQASSLKNKMLEIVNAMDEFELAAFERSVYAAKSFVIALALVKKQITADQASDAAQVEVRSQIEQWGEVEDSHDVDYQDIRRTLGSAACALAKL